MDDTKDEGPSSGKTALVKKLSEYESVPVEWLWPGRVQLGKLSIIMGNPGEGKSFVSLDIAARMSTATHWPTGEECILGNVLIVTGEDDPADTIRPRLEAMGGDPERVFFLEGILKRGRQHPFNLREDQDVIEAMVDSHNISLMIVDPLLAYMSGTDSYKYEQVYDVLMPLNLMCARKRLTTIAIMHMTKNNLVEFAYRAVGSIAFAGACRNQHTVTAETEKRGEVEVVTGRKLFSPLKMTNAEKTSPLAFNLVTTTHPTKGFDIGKLEWDGEVAISTEDILLSSEEKTKLTAAKMLLLKWMEAGGGCAMAKNVEEDNKKNLGLSKSTLDRARKELGIVAESRMSQWWWVKREILEHAG